MTTPKKTLTRTAPPRKKPSTRTAASSGELDSRESVAKDSNRPKSPEARHVLRLYVTGVSRESAHAVERVRAICEEHLHGEYELEVIDIYQLPALAKGDQIVATPTLVRILPAPLRRFIGNLSNDKVLFGLDLRAKT